MKTLRQLFLAWAFAALLPLPMLLAISPTKHADVKCLYLGIASAWFATEVFRPGDPARSRSEWRRRLLAVLIGVAVNVVLFIVLGMSVGIESHIPFPLMAIFSAVPAIGFVPWLSLKTRSPAAVIIAGAMMVAVIKLSACVVARLVYGPSYLEEGYAAADWRTAKLMISLLWTVTIALSAGLLWKSYRCAEVLEMSHDQVGGSAA
jgi:hypothetical protein